MRRKRHKREKLLSEGPYRIYGAFRAGFLARTRRTSPSLRPRASVIDEKVGPEACNLRPDTYQTDQRETDARR